MFITNRHGEIVGIRDHNGQAEPTPYGQAVAEFDAYMPHWREAEAESGAREAGIPDPALEGTVDTWGDTYDGILCTYWTTPEGAAACTLLEDGNGMAAGSTFYV